jgi:hypothetical protein
MTRNIYGDVVDGQGRPSDLGGSAIRNLATFAQMRLDRLERPHDVHPYRADDETLVCIRCGFGIEGGEHSADEIAHMRELVAAHDEGRA